MARPKYFLGIDLGGTKLLTALLDRKFKVLREKKSKVEAQRGEKFFFKTLKEDIAEVLALGKKTPRDLIAIGMGCPGVLEFPSGLVKISPNISFLKSYPLGARLKAVYKVPVVVENDVNAGLYGELHFGAARGHRHVVGIFLGTGIGGGLILDGKLYRGFTGAAGEIGHTFLYPPSFADPAGRDGTLEALAGRLAISSDAALLIMKQKAPHLYEEVEHDVKKIKSKSIARAIRAGDTALRVLIESKARLLGVSMANTVNLLSPELFVLGGGMVEAMASWIIPPAMEVMKRYSLEPMARDVKVVPAKLGDYAIVMGAAKLAFDHLNAGGRKKS